MVLSPKIFITEFGLLTKLLCVGTLLFVFSSSIVQNRQDPNIVLIVADDLGYGDFGSYGATKIATPTIDNLAQEGLKFTNAYVASSICSPSRYSILTGRYSWRTRLKQGVLTWFEKPLIQENRTTLGSLLQRNGYHTAAIGKWHLGFDWALNDQAPENPDENVFSSRDIETQQYIDFSKPVESGPITRGFDYFYGMAGSNNMIPYVFIENDEVVEPPTAEKKWKYEFEQNITTKAPNWDARTLDQHFTDKAVEIIDNHFENQSDDPLFLYYPTSAIHRPCLSTVARGDSRAGLRGDMVEEFDWIVEQIVEALKRNNAFENTLFIITSDNGPRPGDPLQALKDYKNGSLGGDVGESFYLDYFEKEEPEYVNPEGPYMERAGWLTYGHSSTGGLFGFKADAWEGGLRVPFIVHWPDHIKGGQISNRLVVTTDLLETFADITGDELKNSEGEDSYSFLQYLRNPNAPQVRSSMVISSGGSGALVVRKNMWKYIEESPPGSRSSFIPGAPVITEPQLYNLKGDEAEMENLFKQKPQKAEALKTVIDKVKNRSKSERNKGYGFDQE